MVFRADSSGITPYEEHQEEGIATKKWPLPGKDTPNIKGIFTIHSSKEKPGASLAVKYRGYWFSVDETDMKSKATCLVMAELYRLAISEGRPGQVPILPLPVGG